MKWLLGLALLSSCGQTLHVDGEVDGVVSGGTQNSGTVTITEVPPAAAFLPFFLTQCQGLTSGQLCYDPDPNVCANCLANALEAELIPLPTPSPSPT